MAATSASRSERLEARITPHQKMLFQRAATLEGTTVTEFVLSSALRAADLTIRSREITRLTTAESAAFVESLLNPPPPNDALIGAANRYNQLMNQ